MPKKASRKKTTKRPKKVSRKKSKRVTKRKPKYKRRKRRFGSSFYEGLPNYLGEIGGPRSDNTNSIFKQLSSGIKPKKSVSYKEVLERLRGIKGVQALYSKAFTKIGNNTDAAINKRHKAFHTVLVAIISAILQLTGKVGTLQRGKVYTAARQDVKFLPVVSRKQTYSESGLQKYANLPVEQTKITDFNIVERNGVVTGFTHKFRNQLFEVSIFGRQQGNNLFINTLFTQLESRLPALREDSKVDSEFLRVASAYPSAYNASYTTVVNLGSGEIVSTQDPQNNDQVEQLTTDLGTMSVNPNNIIKTTVSGANETVKTFQNPSEKELSEGLKELSISSNPFDDDDLWNAGLKDNDVEIEIIEKEKDGKEFARDSDDDYEDFGGLDFGRRKRKRKVSKKKVSKKKVSKKKVSKKKVSKKKVSKKKGPSAALKKLCKRLKVKLTIKRAGKRVYKSEKVLKGLCKKAAKKSSFGKKPTKIPSALKKKCKKYNIRLTTGKKRVPKTLKKLKKDLDNKLKKIKIRKQKGRAKMIKKAPYYAQKYARYRAKRSLTKRATGALLRSLAKGRPSLFGRRKRTSK